MFGLFGATQRDVNVVEHCATVGMALGVASNLVDLELIKKDDALPLAQSLIAASKLFSEMYSFYELLKEFTGDKPRRKENIDKWRGGDEVAAIHIPPPSEIRKAKETFDKGHEEFVSYFPEAFFAPLKEVVDKGYEAFMGWVGEDEEKLEKACQKYGARLEGTGGLFSSLFGL